MNTTHRKASRAKREDLSLIPKFWQPKVPPDRQILAQVVHWDNLASFVNGTADVSIMWDWVEAGLTYSEMARLLIADGVQITDEAMTAIAEQLGAYESVIKRYRETGKVRFSGPELNIARAAAHVMDQLIETDRHGIAWKARQWSDGEMAKLKTTFDLAMARLNQIATTPRNKGARRLAFATVKFIETQMTAQVEETK